MIGLGATRLEDRRRPDGDCWLILVDLEGNEFCMNTSRAESQAVFLISRTRRGTAAPAVRPCAGLVGREIYVEAAVRCSHTAKAIFWGRP